MKIKNSLSGVKTKPLLTVFLFALLSAVAIRSCQMLKFIEPATGFNTGAGWLMILLYLIIFGCCIAFCLISYLSKDTEIHQPEEINDTATGATGIFFAIALLLDWVSSFFSSTASLGSANSDAGIRGMIASGFLTNFFQSIFAFFAMIYVVILAFDFLKGTQKATRFKILALAPVGWASIRLVHRFIRQISFIEVSDLFLELIMLSFSVLFFMALAQVVSGVNSTGFSWRLTGFGLSGALVALTLNCPRLVFTFINGSEYINPDHPFILADFAFGVFATALIFSLNKKQEVE